MVDRIFAKRPAARSRQTQLGIAGIGFYLAQQMTAKSPNVPHGDDGEVLDISLDREVEVHGVRELVIRHKTGHALHWLENRPVGGRVNRRLHKRKALARIGAFRPLNGSSRYTKVGLCQYCAKGGFPNSKLF